MEDAWKPEPERNGSAKRLSLTRVRSYIREMEARCRPRIAIPFSTGCAAPFRGGFLLTVGGISPCGMGGEKRLRKPVYLLRNETMPQKQCANTQKINKNLGNI